MSASKFLLFGTSYFRSFRSHKSPSLAPSLIFTKRFPSVSLSFHRYYSSAATDAIAEIDTERPSSSTYHPWPEWITFVDRLKAKGYFVELPAKNESEDTTDAGTAGPETLYKDISLLKDACLSFARDRYDVFKSLSTEDIRAVVEDGCPNLSRKAVNSAKRLRAHVQLDEGDVCSACNLRGSCDRAYVILKGSEASPRTVDIVRILLSYAIDPLLISGAEKPPGRELVDGSVRKLLSQFIELGETVPDPALPRTPAKAPSQKQRAVSYNDDELSQNIVKKRGDWMCPKCNFMNFLRNVQCLKCKEDRPKREGQDEIEMRDGDWTCSKCNFMNFSRNLQCLKCKEVRPKRVAPDATGMRNGDWTCSECSFLNFARNTRCLKCKADGPKRIDLDNIEMKRGDWNCPECNFLNFASKKKCLRCQVPRPNSHPGEWDCPSCDFLNYSRNKVCLKCRCERPKEFGGGVLS